MNLLISRALVASPLLLALGAQGPFTLSSSSFEDGAVLQRKFAGSLATNPNCVGENISPQLSWTNVPEGTKSLAFLMVDPEARAGAGVVHWVAYGIRPERSGFAEGEVTKAPTDFVGGKNSPGVDHYMGPCTPAGTTWHHYTFVAVATDLEPDALPAGLTREELLPRLAGHAKGSSGLVGRFRHL